MPAFAYAAALSYGPELGLLEAAPLFEGLHVGDAWLASNQALLVLGALALFEWIAMHQPALRNLALEFEAYPKAGMACLTFAGMLGAVDPVAASHLVREASLFDLVPALAVGGATLGLHGLQHNVKRLLFEADEDDDLGVQRLFAWGEDLWGLFGPLILLLFPLLVLALLSVTFGVFYLIRKRAERREEQARVACANCDTRMYRAALACPACGTANAAPHAVGLLGQSKETLASNPKAHRLTLVEKKRCPVCATRFSQRRAQPSCAVCGHALMQDPAEAQAYLAHVERRLPKVLGITFLLSLVPLVGLIPAVIYYRIQLVAPFRQYISRGQGVLLRWVTRLCLLLLIAFQWVPVLGGLVAPIMGFISYKTYRTAYLKALVPGVSPETSTARGAPRPTRM